VPPPPEYLSGYAREEWLRVSPWLYRLGLLTVLDETLLAVYCDAYATWRTATEALETFGSDAPERKPLTAIERNAARDMVRVARQFGMTTLGRHQLGLGPYGRSPTL
jgi:P27 family predicted phage terminase small subunit